MIAINILNVELICIPIVKQALRAKSEMIVT